jgi:hypothetical protein
MLDKLLAVGSVFDWITPLAALILDRLRGPSYTFLIPQDSGWSGMEVESILRTAGCTPIWGQMIVKDTMMLTVQEDKALQGYLALSRAGVVMQNAWPQRSRRSKDESLLDQLDNLLDW